MQLDFVAGLPPADRRPGLAAIGERMKSRPSFGPCREICREIVTREPIDLSA